MLLALLLAAQMDQSTLEKMALCHSPLGRARLHLFLINKSPWSNLDHDAPFIPGVPPRERGAKRVMLKNVQEAKFKKTLLPIAQVALSANDRGRVSFDAFFTHILMHELMHGLGPHRAASGEPVRRALQETYKLQSVPVDIEPRYTAADSLR